MVFNFFSDLVILGVPQTPNLVRRPEVFDLEVCPQPAILGPYIKCMALDGGRK